MSGLFHTVAVATLPLLPRPLMRALSSRYIAGERLEQALARIRMLRARGFRTIIDILGEDVTDEPSAREVARQYARAATTVAEAGLDTYVSVKPTHVGLRLSEELAAELFGELVSHCEPLGVFVRVEMEDHTAVDATLRIFQRLRESSEHVGVVLQSRLLRTPRDIDALEPGPLNVRLVKGIYLEPAEIAHVEPEPISEAFFQCAVKLFQRGAFVSLATHDDVLADRLLEYVHAQNLGQDRYELQVLMGVRERLWQSWRRAGEPVRVYVPFGPDWRAYSTRRLQKNPEILRAVMRNLFR